MFMYLYNSCHPLNRPWLKQKMLMGQAELEKIQEDLPLTVLFGVGARTLEVCNKVFQNLIDSQLLQTFNDLKLDYYIDIPLLQNKRVEEY